jgi:predicted dehydrogenase
VSGERFAVVGCGTAARHIHLPALRAAGVDVVSFASRSRASAVAARDDWGSGAVYDRYDDAVAAEDVDAVVVATPNAHHAEVAIAAARAGKHVLVDKPLARTTAEADAMIDAAAASGIVLVPYQNTRFARPFVTAADAVAAGRVGAVAGVRAVFGHGGPQHWAPDATWFFDVEVSGGGCLVDLGVHVIDLVRAVTRLEIVEVTAVLAGPAGGVETDAQLAVRLSNGAIGSIHASWQAQPGPDSALTVIGSDATLHVDTRTPLTLFAPNAEPERLALTDARTGPLDEFLAAIRGEREPSVTAADGRAAVAVVEAAYRAASTGRVVELTAGP